SRRIRYAAARVSRAPPVRRSRSSISRGAGCGTRGSTTRAAAGPGTDATSTGVSCRPASTSHARPPADGWRSAAWCGWNSRERCRACEARATLSRPFAPRSPRDHAIPPGPQAGTLVTIETGASDLKAVETLKAARERILSELRKVIVGQDDV